MPTAALSQRVVWTLLPNGFNSKTGRLQLSILVSPRLTLASNISPPDLSHFGDWQDWPKVIRGSTFSVSVDGGAPRSLTPASTPSSKIWAALFPARTLVKPFTFTDLRDKVILSYPVAMIAKGIEAIYGHMGVIAGDDLPDRRDLERMISAARAPLGQQSVLRALRDEAKQVHGGAHGDIAIRQPAAALSLFTAYHAPLSAPVKQGYTKAEVAGQGREPAAWNSTKRVDLPHADDFKKLIDFHQIVASLAQYQALNQLAGLVLAVEIDVGQIPDGDHTLKLVVDWPKSGVGGVQTEGDVLPPVVVRKTARAFVTCPRSAASPIADRYLRLQGGGFELVQLDVDGAALKLKNFATNIARGRPATYDDETFAQGGEAKDAGSGAPSLRTAGLMLAQERRDLAIQHLFAKNGELQDNIDKTLPPLYAEDAIRGYRVDVHDSFSGRWHTLCSRTVDFGFVNDPSQNVSITREEGTIRLAAASAADGSNPDVLKIHEGLFAWKGWSLCAPEPGQVLQPDDAIAPENQTTPDGLPLTTRFTPTGKSLPSLRFGRQYKVRVRLVDLAGQAAEFTEADVQPEGAASNITPYLRHEPVEGPSLALVQGKNGLEAPADGESMGRIAIRTFNDNPAKNTIPTADRARRHLVPPRSTHRFAEQHGVMDTPAGNVDPGLFNTLATLDRPLEQTKVVTPVPGQAHRTVDTTFAVAPDGFSLPFLPDPLAIGVAIKVEGADGVDPNAIHKIPLYGAAWDPAVKPDWPKALPFTVVAAETPLADATWFGDPKFGSQARREFVVPLKKGERARLRISSLMPPAALPKMAVSWMMLAQKPTAAQQAAIGQRIADGQHWMFTPWRTIELVHAVQKPLITPEFAEIGVQRKLFSIAATPDYRLRLHAKTTARIDLLGDWVEPLDDPANTKSKDGPVVNSHHAHVYDKPIARDDTGADHWYASPNLDHVFGDTRYRRVTYRMDATTRYREFMPPEIRDDPTQARIKVSSPPAPTWIPNAAPPPPPKLLYVVPTFGWARHASSGQAASLRVGWGLRVYLARPWFATGFGEMLGVALPPANPPSNLHFGAEPPADTDYKPFITQWGRDPIWTGGAIFTASPPKGAFPLAKWRAPISYDGAGLPADEGVHLPPGDFPVDGLAYPGLASGLSVAPHQVGYDADRKLWYADIVVVPPAGADYFPFVRLALTRYHPVSVAGAHLSNVVLAEFQQLSPWRMAVVTHTSAQTAHVAVYGIGVGPSAASLPATGLFAVEAQVLDAGADDDLGWRSPTPEGAAHVVTPQAGVHQPAAILRRAPLSGEPAAQAAVREHLAVGDYQGLLSKPELVAAAAPPLLWEGDTPLPAAPPGGRRRLVISEREAYLTSPEAPEHPEVHLGAPMRTRVVYFDAIEV